MPDFNDRFPMSVLSPAVKVKADEGVDVIARLTLPWSCNNDNVRFASAISNPPGVDTDYPAITVKQYGKGRAMFVAAPVQHDNLAAVKAVFISLVRYMLPEKSFFETNAPDWLELSLFRSYDIYRLMAYNAMDAYYIVIAPVVRVRVRIPEKPVKLINAATVAELPFTYADGEVEAELGDIESFGEFIIKLK